MVQVSDNDMQQIEDFLDYWANPRKSSPALNILESKAKELRKRCEYARKGYPVGTLERDKPTGEPTEREVRACEVPGCGNLTFNKRCTAHASKGK